MAELKKRGRVYWLRLRVGKLRIEESLKTSDLGQARDIEARYKLSTSPESGDVPVQESLRQYVDHLGVVRGRKSAQTDGLPPRCRPAVVLRLPRRQRVSLPSESPLPGAAVTTSCWTYQPHRSRSGPRAHHAPVCGYLAGPLDRAALHDRKSAKVSPVMADCAGSQRTVLTTLTVMLCQRGVRHGGNV